MKTKKASKAFSRAFFRAFQKFFIHLWRPSDWPVWVRWLAPIGLVVALDAVVIAVANGQFSLSLSALGCGNLAFSNAIIGWYLLDALVPRRTIYRWVGIDEDPLKPELRFWRKLLLLASLLGGMVAAGREIAKPDDALTPMFLLVGVFIAALGWMYTDFQNEKGRRASNTLQAIRDQFYEAEIAETYRRMRAMIDHYRATTGLDRTDVLPLAAMTLTLGEVESDVLADGPSGLTLEHVADRFLNALDQLAFGVRQGQFDLRTVEMVLRPRFVRIGYALAEYIRQQTNARRDLSTGLYRSRVRTWEHFLWLLSKFDVLKNDCVDPAKLIAPPDHIIGKRKKERVKRPAEDAPAPIWPNPKNDDEPAAERPAGG